MSGKWLYTSSKVRPSSKEGQDKEKKGSRWQEGRIVLGMIFQLHSPKYPT